jgi:3-oxoacyl-[acyl-carrier-protein] synthase-3
MMATLRTDPEQNRRVPDLRSVVVGTGSCLPARVVTNAELAEQVDTSDEWIVQRTGIRQRHIAAAGLPKSPWTMPA